MGGAQDDSFGPSCDRPLETYGNTRLAQIVTGKETAKRFFHRHKHSREELTKSIAANCAPANYTRIKLKRLADIPDRVDVVCALLSFLTLSFKCENASGRERRASARVFLMDGIFELFSRAVQNSGKDLKSNEEF